MLDYIRYFLYAALIFVLVLLYQAWQQEHQVNPGSSALSQLGSGPAATVPAQPVQEMKSTKPLSHSSSSASQTGKIVDVQTDVMHVKINTLGGDIWEVSLPKYAENLGSKQPVILLNNNPQTRYLAESGLLSSQGPDSNEERAQYITQQTDYTLAPNAKDLTIDLHWTNSAGLEITKQFIFTRGSYQILVKYLIHNGTSKPWQGQLYNQIQRTDTPPATYTGLGKLTLYFGGAISTQEKVFQKISFKEMAEGNLNIVSKDGWAAMIQHYFISAWVPPTLDIARFYSHVSRNGLYTIGMIANQATDVSPGQTKEIDSKFYAGPAIQKLLEQTAPNLQLTIDYGWLWFISEFLFWIMQLIHRVVGNWGWSIIILTIFIKLVFYKLSAKSYRSMGALKKLQPRIEALKEQFKDDRQKLTQATLDLYRKEKVNPMSGCLPILVQIPVFFALYWVLVESVQLRQAPFILWIHDLSAKDPFYVLPVLMGLSMFIQQRMNPPPPDPTQAKILMFMPVVLTVMFLNFPAGLMLYWIVNNTISFLQQWYVMHYSQKR